MYLQTEEIRTESAGEQNQAAAALAALRARYPVESALQSTDPQTRATAVRALQGFQSTLQQVMRQKRRQGLRLPVVQVLQSDVAQDRRSAQRAAQGLLGTLEAIARKKQQVENTMAQLRRETRAARLRRRWRIVVGIALVALLLWLHFGLNVRIYTWWWLFQFGGGGLLADAAHSRRAAARTLRESWDPRAVGVLAIALRDGDAYVKMTAEEALCALLPRVRASDAAYIDAEQMEALLAIAYRPGVIPMKVALLKALEQIGDARAIPAVEWLELDGTSEIRRAAKDCLPFLEERARLAAESATLLRASSGNAVSTPAQLLRPASPVPAETPTDQLLRLPPEQ